MQAFLRTCKVLFCTDTRKKNVFQVGHMEWIVITTESYYFLITTAFIVS